MRLRTAILTALAMGACDTPADESVAVANAQVPLTYSSSVYGGPSTPGPRTNTPGEAYSAALARLDQACSTPPRKRHECLGNSEISITPYIYEPGVPDPIEKYGYAATINRYIEGVNAVRNMFATRSDARAADFRVSLSVMQVLLNSYTSSAKWVLRERDELVEQARAFTEKLTQAGEALYGEERGKLVRKRQLIRESRAVLERYRSAVAERQSEYEALAVEYKAFQSAEPIETLQSIATRASTAELPGFPALQQELMALLSAENGTPQDLTLRAARLQGFFESQRRWFEAEIERYRTFLAEEGVATPDLTSRSIEVLTGMQRYLAGRQQRLNAAASKLLDGMKRRKSALVLLERDAQTRQTLGDATRARAAADFLNQATAQIQATWAAQPSAAGFELIGGRYQAVLALLQVASLCDDEDAADWMNDGCGAYATNASKATLYLQSTLPRKLRRDANQFRIAGAPAMEVSALETAVNAGDLAKAVMIHDNLAHHLEATP